MNVFINFGGGEMKKKYRIQSFSLLFTVILVLSLLACAANPPVIKDFSVAKSTISSGESTILFWQIENADKITINNGVGSVDFIGNTEVKPTTSTTYTVVASNKAGNVTKSVNITVLAKTVPPESPPATTPPQQQTPPSSQPPPTVQPPTQPPPDATDIVYITKTGEKYHRAGCRYLSQSSIPIQRSEAIKKGYTACSVCKP